MRLFLLGAAVLIIGTALAQNGGYVEMKMTSTQGVNGTVKIYYSQLGSRTETDMKIPQMPGGGMKTVYLFKNDQPNTIILLNDKNKTYTEIKTNEDAAEGNIEDKNEYTIKKLGEETINGYKCAHALITSGEESYEVWNTKDISDYYKYSDIYNKNPELGSSKREKALREAGCEGFPIKTVHKGDKETGTIIIEMVKMEKKDFGTLMFEVPVGYTKSQSMSPGLPFNMEDMQKMSPEERQKFMEEMEKKYKGGN